MKAWLRVKAWLRRTDWVLWGALACTLAGTFHAEYTLAVATGMNKVVAACVPGALDLYVVRALQVRRDVLGAVLGMVAVNVVSHLFQARVLDMHWAIVSAVGALAPLVLWRVHHLFRVQARVPEPDTVPDTADEGLWDGWGDEHTSDTESGGRVWREYVSDTGALISYEAADTDTVSVSVPYPPLVSVPEPVDPEQGSELEHGCPWDHEECDGEEACTVYSHPVPGPDTEQVHEEYDPDTELPDRDRPYLGSLKAYLDTVEEAGTQVTLRGCMEFVKVGQDRARRLLKYAGYPKEAQT